MFDDIDHDDVDDVIGLKKGDDGILLARRNDIRANVCGQRHDSSLFVQKDRWKNPQGVVPISMILPKNFQTKWER